MRYSGSRAPLNSIKSLLGIALDLREYSLQEAHPVALFICPVTCPPHHWTSSALFTANEVTNKK